jgi:hemerythrin-like domain-containing protein
MLKVLQENVEHHVEEEEGDLFKKAKDVLSEEEAGRIGEEIEAFKAEKLQLEKAS